MKFSWHYKIKLNMNVILKIGLIFNLGYLVKQFKNMNILTTKMFNTFHYICVCVFLFHFILFVTMPLPFWAMGPIRTFGIVKKVSMKWCASLSLCNFKIINVFSSYWSYLFPFTSHEEMHEELPIDHFICLFILSLFTLLNQQHMSPQL